MTKRTFIFYPEWLDYIDRLNNEKDKLDLYDIIISYGCRGEYSNENPMMVSIFESFIKHKIDIAQANYEDRVSMGKTVGRKKTVNDDAIKTLAQSGLKARDIAERLNISTDAVYHSEGWKTRDL